MAPEPLRPETTEPPPAAAGSNRVSLLIVEDERSDAELAVEALEAGGFDVSWLLAANQAEYLAALQTGVDVILCDNSLPEFDAGRAFELLQDARLRIPLIVVSGAISEAQAVQYLQLGAYDYIAKDELGRLAVAVRRALERSRYEREVHAAEVRFDAARAQAAAASRLKSEFLASMSHEIRTPMNGVLGLTELLLDTALTVEQRQYAELISRSAESLLTVINDILDLTKIEAGRLEIEATDFDLPTVIHDAAQLVAMRADEKELELVVMVEAGLPAAVRGDPTRVRQVLVNLLGNAVKFTESGEVVLRVEAAGETPAGRHVVRFSVTDTGIGIAPEHRDRIFEIFVQADASTSRRVGGTGLGLPICRQLVERMGGEIGVESEIGKGSCFWFTCAFERAQEVPAAPAGDGPSLDGVRVLVVDDNRTNRFILEHHLRAWAMRPWSCASAADALTELTRAAAAGEPYGLAILDGRMPGMSGVELALAIRADPATASTRLALLTSTAQGGAGRLAREAGIEALITKPVRAAALHDRLAALMDGSATDAPPPPLAMRPRTDESGSGARLLVVDDNDVNRLVEVRMLERMGHRVDVAGNGLEAVAAVARARYAAVLMDCQMPEMDGFQATAEIRRLEPAGTHLPIIALTADAMAGDAERCLAAGMDAYLSKPVTAGSLAAALGRCLRADQPSGPDGSPAVEAAPVAPPLEEQLAQRTAQLEAVKSELTAFTHSVAHDLRAPLRAITAFAGLLEKKHADRLGGEAGRYVQRVAANAARMSQLLEGLLRFSRAGSAELRLAPVDPARIARDAADGLRDQAREGGVEVTVEPMPGCVGDAALLRTLYTELLSNAIRFSRGRDRARVEVGAHREGEETVYHVKDNGVGFDMRYAGRLFGVFQQLHERAPSDGAGVGLAIAQRIVHRHAGRIWAEAQPDRGATVHLTLPGGAP